jgi:hypothetical protein
MVRYLIRKGSLPAERRGLKLWTVDEYDVTTLAAKRAASPAVILQ